ncbi:MAG: hypothetical protein KZQ83_04135 [gamma proteobacterium symbiont of Taylorina sp.]|nr:hypothetical protein [gamma proteobacterium symbiont of Taylorina sp.]
MYKLFLLIFLLTIAMPLVSANSLTDPTRPANSQTPGIESSIDYKTTYKLSQIHIRNRHKAAIVNGQKVVAGDWLDDTTESAEVLDITANSVRLLIDNSHIKVLTIAPLIKEYNR